MKEVKCEAVHRKIELPWSPRPKPLECWSSAPRKRTRSFAERIASMW